MKMLEDSKKVSVIIPCYNDGRYLLEAIESVEKCDKDSYEIIIIDDGSIDRKTIEAIDSAKKMGYRVFHIEHRGQSAARNFGAKNAKYDYLLFLDADNKILPDYLSKGAEALSKNPLVGVVFGDRKEFGFSTNTIIQRFNASEIIFMSTVDTCAVVRKKAWQSCGGFDEKLDFWEDWEFFINICARGWEFHHIPGIMFEYRIKPSSVNTKSKIKEHRTKFLKYVYEKHSRFFVDKWGDLAAGIIIHNKNEEIAKLRKITQEIEFKLSQSVQELHNIKKSISWKFSQIIEKIIFYFIPENSRFRVFYKILIKKIQNFFENKDISSNDYNRRYQLWIKKNEPRLENFPRLKKEAARLFYRPLISIVMPTYNINEVYLRAAIESVQQQFYLNWELCVADDGSTKPVVKKVLEEYRQNDKRIKAVYLAKNQGISGASNSALSLATGQFVGLLDCDDELAPWALLEIVKLLNQNQKLDFIYSDEDKLEPDGSRSEPFLKPDFSPDLLMSMNYITHFCVFRREIINRIGGFRKKFEGSQDYDLILRVSESTKNIAHISNVLYHWRKIPGSTSGNINAKNYVYPAAIKALQSALIRRKQSGKIIMLSPGLYRARYKVIGRPFVSIIIPTKDKINLLRRCIDSIQQKNTYSNYEIIVVDNESYETETKSYFKRLANKPNHQVLSFDQPFNYARLNNFAVKRARGDFLLFLNNDTEVITPDWLEEMLGNVQRAEVGAVGAKLLFQDNKIQHAGVVVGLHGVADHAFYGLPVSEHGYRGLTTVARNCSAVTSACLIMRRSVFEEIGGFDEKLDVIFNDIDLCLKIIQRGYYIVWTPHAILYHHESATRGQYNPERNVRYFCEKWRDFLECGDPFYNPNLALNRNDFMIKI